MFLKFTIYFKITIDHVVVTRQLIEEPPARCRRSKTESWQKRDGSFRDGYSTGEKRKGQALSVREA